MPGIRRKRKLLWGLTAPNPALLSVTGCHHQGAPSPLQQNVAITCLFASPASSATLRVWSQIYWFDLSQVHTVHIQWPSMSGPQALRGFSQDSFGWLVTLPLGLRPADPHSTAVWCGNLLHSCPQPHTAGLGSCPSPEWSNRYYNQDLHQKMLQPGATPACVAIFHVHSTRLMLCWAATAAVSYGTDSASLTWAPSIFGAAGFGR